MALCHGVFMHKNGDKAELSRVNEAYRNFVKVQLPPPPALLLLRVEAAEQAPVVAVCGSIYAAQWRTES